jgi:hypothetical protein
LEVEGYTIVRTATPTSEQASLISHTGKDIASEMELSLSGERNIFLLKFIIRITFLKQSFNFGLCKMVESQTSIKFRLFL